MASQGGGPSFSPMEREEVHRYLAAALAAAHSSSDKQKEDGHGIPPHQGMERLATSLFQAATRGDLGKVQQLVACIEEGLHKSYYQASPPPQQGSKEEALLGKSRTHEFLARLLQTRDADGQTLLHHAASKGHLPVVKYLVGCGADVNALDRWNGTPLEEAFKAGDWETVAFLKDAGGKLDVLPPEDLALQMCQAASKGSLEDLQRLALAGADLDQGDYDRRTPLHLAAAEGHLFVVEFLVEQGADVNLHDRWGGTPLQDAINNDHPEVADFLRHHGAILQTVASSLKRPRIAEDGATSEEDSGGAWTRASSGDIKGLKSLQEKGVDLGLPDYYQRTPLHLAASEGQLDTVKYLVGCGVNVNAADRWGNTPLQEALIKGHKQVARFLKENGAVVGNVPDAGALCEAAGNGDLEKVKQLVERHGADVNAADYDRRTPLHLASSEGHLEVVQYLVEHGALLSAKDRWGSNPYQDALRNNFTSVAEFLNKDAKFTLAERLSLDDDDESNDHPCYSSEEIESESEEACEEVHDDEHQISAAKPKTVTFGTTTTTTTTKILRLPDSVFLSSAQSKPVLPGISYSLNSFRALLCDPTSQTPHLSCCQRFGRNREGFHFAFKKVLKQFVQLDEWDYADLWTLRPDFSVLECCSDCWHFSSHVTKSRRRRNRTSSCSISVGTPRQDNSAEQHSNMEEEEETDLEKTKEEMAQERQRKTHQLKLFRETTKNLLIEVSSFFSGSIFVNRKPVWYERLSHMLQMNFIQSPMARVCSLKSCVAIPINYEFKDRHETIGVVTLYSWNEVRSEKDNEEKLKLWTQVCSTAASLLVSFYQLIILKQQAISKHDYADTISHCIDFAKEFYSDRGSEENKTYDFFPILLHIGALKPIFKWACSLDSEEHRAVAPILSSLANASSTLRKKGYLDVIIRKLEYSLHFLKKVSPVTTARTPVRGIAEKALAVLEDNGFIEKTEGEYFSNGVESPALKALKALPKRLQREFDAFPQKDALDELDARVKQRKKEHSEKREKEEKESTSSKPKPVFSFASFCQASDPFGDVTTTEVFRVLGVHETQRSGSGIWGNQPSYDNQEAKRVAQISNDLLKQDQLCTLESIKLLHGALSLDQGLKPGEFRQSLVVGSHLYYTFYRVFLPCHEISAGLEAMERVMRKYANKWNTVEMAYYVYTVIVHYIHPFPDGNGRVSRVMAALLLKQQGYPLLYKHTDKTMSFEQLAERVLQETKL